MDPFDKKRAGKIITYFSRDLVMRGQVSFK